MADNTCPICLDTIGESNSCNTSCNHSFCLSCLYTSLQNKVSCPMCRKELVPKNEDREEVVKLRDNLDRMYMTMDGMHNNISELHNTISVLHVEQKIHKRYENEVLSLIDRYSFIDEPLSPKKMSEEPCAICGCSSECDVYGDRICFCDSCTCWGCVDEKNKWRRQWKIMSINARKDLNM